MKIFFYSYSVSTGLAASVQTKQGGSRKAPLLVTKPDRTCRVKGMIQMGKMVMGKRFNPDRCGMIYCPFCKGLGKLFDEAEGRVDCKTCGGFDFRV